MMFRSAHADEESGSDWDDYSPAPTPLPSESQGSTSASPPKTLPKSSIATPTIQTHVHTARHSPHKTVQIKAVSSSPADHVIRPLESELTQLATVSPPRTPATSLPQPLAAAVYRTTTYDEGERENPANHGSHGNVPIEAPSTDNDGQLNQPQLGVEHALEFSHVSGQSADVLSPSYDLPYSYMAGIADKSERYANRCTEEIFSTFRVASDFIIAFLLGCCHYLLHSITRKLLCGLAHICADSLFKPMIHICFNGYCWPLLSLCSHMCKGGVVILTPLLELVRAVVAMATNCVAAFRPVQVNIHSKHHANA